MRIHSHSTACGAVFGTRKKSTVKKMNKIEKNRKSTKSSKIEFGAWGRRDWLKTFAFTPPRDDPWSHFRKKKKMAPITTGPRLVNLGRNRRLMGAAPHPLTPHPRSKVAHPLIAQAPRVPPGWNCICTLHTHGPCPPPSLGTSHWFMLPCVACAYVAGCVAIGPAAAWPVAAPPSPACADPSASGKPHQAPAYPGGAGRHPVGCPHVPSRSCLALAAACASMSCCCLSVAGVLPLTMSAGLVRVGCQT